jgi:GAF domain-containing protein
MSTVQNAQSETDGIYKRGSLIQGREIREPFLKSLIRGQTIGIGGLIVMVAFGGIFDHSLLSLLPLGGLAVIVGLAASWVLRRGHFIASGFLFFIGTSLAISINVYIRGYQDASSLYYLWPILGAVSILEGRGGVVVLITSLLSYLTLAIGQRIGFLHPPIQFDPQGGAFLTMGSFAIMFSLLAYLAWLSSQNTNQALNQAQQSARKLQEVNETLENRVAVRTQSLELAADVGHSVSQVRALDVMLKDAAEIIRARFDLYYVQVYLTDLNQTNLILQSGTGSVGAELVGRGHRLPLNTASINGRAAIEKRSVVVEDTAASATFKPNPLLPDTRSEMAVPLLIGEKVVGVLDLQSQQANTLNQDILPAFEALAGQLAIAIQNASLLAQTEQARAEVEKQVRRLTRTNWDDYMDAIHTPEYMGFAFEKNMVTPLVQDAPLPPADGKAISAPITVAGESLGTLVVEMNESNAGLKNAELVNIVASQVAQQIENLRLLESAERYRTEAEQASRRLTREGWKDYIQANTDESMGYIYDLKKVRSFNQTGDQQAEESAFNLPIKVRDETVGKISLQGILPNDKESIDLAKAISERLGAHIESLRQFDQTQSALAQTEKLSVASLRFAQSADLHELLVVAMETLGIPVINRALLGVFNYSSANELESMDIAANWWNGSGNEPSEIGRHYSIETLNVLPLFMSATLVFFNDTFHDERVNGSSLELVTKQNIHSMAVVPLFLGARQIGVLLLESEETHIFTQSDTRLFSAMAPQIATVLENRRQFERAQQQAKRETLLNAIGQKIRSATSVDAVLQIAARELGTALGAPLTIAQLSLKDKK